jgi:hypothetical protein
VIRLVIRTAMVVVSNAAGLLIAAYLLEGMTLDLTGKFVAVGLFTVALALMLPSLATMLRRRRSGAPGSALR